MNLFWCPSINDNCGVGEYTRILAHKTQSQTTTTLSSVPSTITSIHVQHEYSLFDAGTGVAAAQLYKAAYGKVPSFATLHTVFRDESRMTILGKNRNPLELYTDAVIVLNSLSVPLIQKRSPDLRVCFIPIGCFLPHDESRKKRGKTIGMFGFINEAKGYRAVLRSLKELPDVTLRVYSSFVFDPHVERQLHRAGIEVITDYMPTSVLIQRLARECDALIYWHRENKAISGSSSLTYGLSSGVPILASRTSWFHDAREFGAVYTPTHLTTGIEEILENDELRVTVRERAREYCKTYSWDSIAKEHKKIWREGCS